ncbi:MAG: hypothetical protein HY902_20005 [Deltaproteobacteria bacterium]|nr:hypothetical protein [Deltaproteobacteria bacterium]
MRVSTSLTLALTAVLSVLLMGAARPAEAQSAIGTSKNFGIGLELGHGAGLSVKVASSPTSMWQFGLDFYNYGRYRTYYRDHGRYYSTYDYGFDSASFLVHGEYLAHQASLVQNKALALPWYVGGGLDLGVGAGTALGVHGNLGLALQFNRVPIDLFLEWTPRVWLVDFVQVQPLEFNGGVRFWF